MNTVRLSKCHSIRSLKLNEFMYTHTHTHESSVITFNVYLTFGNEKKGIATTIKSRPHSRKPNHHSPMNLLSDGSVYVE